MDILQTVQDNLFDQMANCLFQCPENVHGEITDIFYSVDQLCCEEKAKQLSLITKSNKACFPCFKSSKPISNEVITPWSADL